MRYLIKSKLKLNMTGKLSGTATISHHHLICDLIPCWNNKKKDTLFKCLQQHLKYYLNFEYIIRIQLFTVTIQMALN